SVKIGACEALSSIGAKPPPCSRRSTTSLAPVRWSIGPTVAAGEAVGAVDGSGFDGVGEPVVGGDPVAPLQAATRSATTAAAAGRWTGTRNLVSMAAGRRDLWTGSRTV